MVAKKFLRLPRYEPRSLVFSAEFVYDVRQLSGGDCDAELLAAAKVVGEAVGDQKPAIVAFGFKNPAEQLTPAFVQALIKKVFDIRKKINYFNPTL